MQDFLRKMIWVGKYRKITVLILLLASAILLSRQLVHNSGQNHDLQLVPDTSRSAVKAASSEIEGEWSIITPSTWPELYYSIPLDQEYLLQVSLNIETIKEPPPAAYWCGAPFYLDYIGEAKATIANQAGEIVDELELTSPSLVLGKPPDYDFYYYKLYDIDGDGEKNEFVILNYFSCNGNLLRVVKVDKDKHKFSTIPFQLSEEVVEEVTVDPHKEDLVFNKGKLTTNSYNTLEGVVYTNTFVYSKGVFTHVEREIKEARAK